MGAFERELRRLQPSFEEEARERALAEAIFREWRDRYVALLCQFIRVSRDAKQASCALAGDPTMEWANAAVHILTVGPLDVQDVFMRAPPEVKDTLVLAVLSDGGVTDLTGFFSDLPPL